MSDLRIAVFASGQGSNLHAILAAIADGRLRASIVLVVGNRPEIGAFEVAREFGVPAKLLTSAQFPDEPAFDRALIATLEEHNVGLIALAGYLKKLSPAVVEAFAGQIVNIHPALLPAFGGKGMYGLNVHRAVIEYGCKVSGVTVHLVDSDYDNGPPVAQRCVPVEQGDTPDSLAARVLELEHRLYPEVLQLFAEGRVKVNGRRISILRSGGP